MKFCVPTGILIVPIPATVLIPTSVIIFVTPRPIDVSRINASTVSLVILSLTSFTVTSPIGSETAKEVAASGSATGLSRLTWGYRCLIDWVNYSPVNGLTEGEFDAFNTVK